MWPFSLEMRIQIFFDVRFYCARGTPGPVFFQHFVCTPVSLFVQRRSGLREWGQKFCTATLPRVKPFRALVEFFVPPGAQRRKLPAVHRLDAKIQKNLDAVQRGVDEAVAIAKRAPVSGPRSSAAKAKGSVGQQTRVELRSPVQGPRSSVSGHESPIAPKTRPKLAPRPKAIAAKQKSKAAPKAKAAPSDHVPLDGLKAQALPQATSKRHPRCNLSPRFGSEQSFGTYLCVSASFKTPQQFSILEHTAPGRTRCNRSPHESEVFPVELSSSSSPSSSPSSGLRRKGPSRRPVALRSPSGSPLPTSRPLRSRSRSPVRLRPRSPSPAGQRSSGPRSPSRSASPATQEWKMRDQWTCRECNNNNLRFTLICSTCMSQKPDNIEMSEGDWRCEGCGHLNFKIRTTCHWGDCPTRDWVCSCGNRNFGRRLRCNMRKCNLPRPSHIPPNRSPPREMRVRFRSPPRHWQ